MSQQLQDYSDPIYELWLLIFRFLFLVFVGFFHVMLKVAIWGTVPSNMWCPIVTKRASMGII